MRVVVIAFACVLTVGASAQPMSVQLAAAHNDKLQRAYTPYSVALGEQIGPERLRQLQPIVERRVACKWGGVWQECGYLLIRNASILDAGERKAVRDLMLNPCVGIEKTLARAPSSKVIHASRAKALRQLCAMNALLSGEVRDAEPGSTLEEKSKPSSPGDLALESRISTPSTKVN
ncbi:hypothetical protein HLB44_09310 [Aquincola sp. S2]|uniref:Uncharacterized protein n=1 Tax=Pseudaquabacterium terrae TaxID=2732868 RepID=A0ABX2EEZ9_9BURK|nr:hypothetical protein [Aquabacterium terrae]NRF67179.1 hypothetical protein [Aquabacterium terrae]